MVGRIVEIQKPYEVKMKISGAAGMFARVDMEA